MKQFFPHLAILGHHGVSDLDQLIAFLLQHLQLGHAEQYSIFRLNNIGSRGYDFQCGHNAQSKYVFITHDK